MTDSARSSGDTSSPWTGTSDSPPSSINTSDAGGPQAFDKLCISGGSDTANVAPVGDNGVCPKEDNGNSVYFPASAEMLDDPGRWNRLEITPSKTPLKDQYLVPDPSPILNSSDTDSMETAEEHISPFVRQKRRGEHVTRPPVWKLYDKDLKQPPKLAKASRSVLAPGKENAPIRGGKLKKVSVDEPFDHGFGLAWLRKDPARDHSPFITAYQPALTVYMGGQGESSQPLQRVEDSSSEHLPAKAYCPKVSSRAQPNEGIVEAQDGSTATPSAQQTGANTAGEGTATSHTPVTGPSETPCDPASTQEPASKHPVAGGPVPLTDRRRPSTTDQIIEQTERRLASPELAEELRLRDHSGATDDPIPQNLEDLPSLAQTRMLVEDEQSFERARHNLNNVTTNQDEQRPDAGINNAQDVPHGEQHLDSGSNFGLGEGFDEDSRAYQGFLAQARLLQLSPYAQPGETETIPHAPVSPFALGTTVGLDDGPARDVIMHIMDGDDPELDEQAREVLARENPFRHRFLYDNYAATYYSDWPVTDDSGEPLVPIDAYVKMACRWYAGIRDASRARNAAAAARARPEHAEEAWHETIHKVEPTDEQTVPTGGEREAGPVASGDRPAASAEQGVLRRLRGIGRRDRAQTPAIRPLSADADAHGDAEAKRRKEKKLMKKSIHYLRKRLGVGATEPSRGAKKTRPRVYSSHFREDFDSEDVYRSSREDPLQPQRTSRRDIGEAPEEIRQEGDRVAAGIPPANAAARILPEESYGHPLPSLSRNRGSLFDQPLPTSPESQADIFAQPPLSSLETPRNASGQSSNIIPPRDVGPLIDLGPEDGDGLVPLQRTPSRRPSDRPTDGKHPSELPFSSDRASAPTSQPSDSKKKKPRKLVKAPNSTIHEGPAAPIDPDHIIPLKGTPKTIEEVLQGFVNNEIRARQEAEEGRDTSRSCGHESGSGTSNKDSGPKPKRKLKTFYPPPESEAKPMSKGGKHRVEGIDRVVSDRPIPESQAPAHRSSLNVVDTIPENVARKDFAATRDWLMKKTDSNTPLLGEDTDETERKPWYYRLTKKMKSDEDEGKGKEKKDDKKYNKKGFDKDGYDRDGYDKDGYDRKGFGKDGFNRKGRDKDDYDREGRHGPMNNTKGVGGFN